MRFLVEFSFDAESGNELIREGRLGPIIQSILEELKPEAAYFTTFSGRRRGIFIVEMDDASQIPAVAEPLFFGLNATVKFSPVMAAEDLQRAGESMAKAAEKYG